MSRTETVENLVNEAHNGDLVEIKLIMIFFGLYYGIY